MAIFLLWFSFLAIVTFLILMIIKTVKFLLLGLLQMAENVGVFLTIFAAITFIYYAILNLITAFMALNFEKIWGLIILGGLFGGIIFATVRFLGSILELVLEYAVIGLSFILDPVEDKMEEFYEKILISIKKRINA